MEKRRCDQCEYYEKIGVVARPTCMRKPPKYYVDRGYRRPEIKDDTYCHKWEPKWSDNPVLAEAWLQFKMVHKLITCGEKDG